jgi:hypothetical protein
MSPTRKASSVAGLRRGVAAPPGAPAAASSAEVPQRRPRPARPRPVRFTLDLDPPRHQYLKDYATRIEADAAEVMRALLDELRDDDGLADRVRARIWQAD